MKNTLTIISLICISFTGFSQDYYGDNLNSNMYTASQIIGNPSVQPPDVAAFQKVNFVPVTNYTGRTNISIPIYEISAGSMIVPISLSYNSSGVKVADMASSVGLNWSLNAGGMISRMIKGMSDFTVPHDPGNVTPSMTPSGWLGHFHPSLDMTYTTNIYNDSEPDLFSVNAPGLSTKYTHSRTYAANPDYLGRISIYSNAEAIELEPQGNIINETIGLVTKNYLNDYTGTYNDIISFGLTNVEITSMSGVVYNFATPDLSRYHGNTYTDNILYKLESYRLDKMFDPSTNQIINFEYEQYSNYFYDEIDSGVTTYGNGTYLGFNSTKKTHTVYPYTQRLKRILFDKGEVEFIYGLNRLDNTGDKALTEIKVKDQNGNIIKHVKFDYTYFQSSIESSTPQSKRLRLDKVFEVDANLNELPGYTFQYDTTFEMPPRSSYAHDYLGYNNGSYSSLISVPTPKYYFKYSNDPFNKYLDISPFYDASAIELTGNFSLEANEDYAKAYSLTKITYPTGGTNDYEYEINEFYHKSVNKLGGGIRIKSQSLDDGKGNVQIFDYEYTSGSIGKFPTFAVIEGSLSNNPTTLSELVSSMGIDTFMSPHSQIEFTQGSFVGYQKVTIKNRVNNGSKVYFYKSPTSSNYSFANIKPIIEYDNLHSESVDWVAYTSPSLFADRDFLRGKITYEQVYNKVGELRLEKIYTYTQKDFSTISLEFLNKSSSHPLDNCYYDNGEYKLNEGKCGGYLEKIDIPIARDLLTTVITKDYQSDKIVYTQGGNENVPYTFQTVQKYFYDTKLPLVLLEEKRVMNSHISDWDIQDNTQDYDQISDEYDDRVFKAITYPLTGEEDGMQNADIISNLPYANELITLNKLSTPLTIEFKNKDREVIAKEDHYYNDFGSVIGLENIHFMSRDGSTTESELITKRDIKGRITEYKKKNGVYVSRIYGYDSNYLIAEVVNSTELNTLLKLQNIQTPFNQDTTANADNIRTMMSELREVMPEAQITSYTYTPLIGVTSITDPRGETIYYEYDEFNRLIQVKDAQLNILSKNEYHYKNQQ
ncbi:RHS repeat domain-containing protein [Lutibacter sp.]|uniref:RHS repeat domain-containing protein n=1 Tax=Lutibacter sp. TaxID=1925666 RepID=UPI0025BE8DE3|nr:RHS repeat domain-containing protein [Lutibacter sp.]MCF6168797.1 RHS repeat protein [Lutibacter sp.]